MTGTISSPKGNTTLTLPNKKLNGPDLRDHKSYKNRSNLSIDTEDCNESLKAERKSLNRNADPHLKTSSSLKMLKEKAASNVATQGVLPLLNPHISQDFSSGQQKLN